MEILSGNWQNMPHVHSPAGSDDSGVELSPNRNFPYGSFEDCCALVTGEASYPESPTRLNGTWRMNKDPNAVVYPQTPFPEQLTPDELDALSDTLSLSPCSAEQQIPSVEELTEIGQFDFSPRRPTDDLDALLNSVNQEPSDNTLKKKRRQKARCIGLRQAHPGVDPCLVPKSGTAKPRQSRKKRKAGTVESMAGGAGAIMNHKKCYSGARVKETAREKLQRLRNQRGDGTEQKQRSPALQVIQPPVKRQNTTGSDMGASYAFMYPTNMPATSAPQTTQPYIPHSVNQILGSASHGYAQDNLDDIIANALQRINTRALEEYAENASRSYMSCGETALHYILHRLNERKDTFPTQNIRRVMEIATRIFPNDINVENLQGETPIYRAALFGNEGAVQALMDVGADPWKQERTAGETSVHAAVKSKNLNVVMIILDKMRERGAPLEPGINLKTFDGNTSLHKAAALSDMNPPLQETMIRELIRAGADTTVKNNMSQMPHSFLSENLKEVQNGMKRLNGRKRALAQQAMSANVPHMEAPSYYNPTVFQQQLPHHFAPELIQPHITHPTHAFTHRQQFAYGGLPPPPHYFPCSSGQQSYPPMESLPTPLPHYDPYGAGPTGGVPHHPGNPVNHEVDLEDIFS